MNLPIRCQCGSCQAMKDSYDYVYKKDYKELQEEYDLLKAKSDAKDRLIKKLSDELVSKRAEEVGK